MAGRGLCRASAPATTASPIAERGEIYDLVRDAGDHRLRDRLRRPPQLLGRLCDRGAAARPVRAGRAELRRRRRCPAPARWKAMSTVCRRTIRCAPCSSPTAPARRSRSRPATCWRSTASARASNMRRASTSARARALSNPDARAAPRVRRRRRPRLCDGPADRRRDAHRVRLHPAPGHPQRPPRRRPPALPRRPQREAVGEGRAAADGAAGAGGGCGTVDLGRGRWVALGTICHRRRSPSLSVCK